MREVLGSLCSVGGTVSVVVTIEQWGRTAGAFPKQQKCLVAMGPLRPCLE